MNRMIHLASILCFLVGCSSQLLSQPIHRFKKVVGEPNMWHQSSCINTTFDDGFILGGSRWDGFVASSYLIKTDSLGNTEWIREYFYSDRNFIADVLQTTDGGYIFTGSASNASQWYDLQVIKTDGSGNIEWSYTFSNRIGQNATNAGGSKIIEDSGSYFVLGGFSTSPGSEEGAILLRLDLVGNILQSNTVYTPYPAFMSEHATIMLSKLQNGNYVATFPYRGLWSFIFSFDLQCNFLWSYSFYNPQCYYNDALAVCELPNTDLLLMTRGTDSTGLEYLYLNRVTQSGAVRNSTRYDLPGLWLGRTATTFTDRYGVAITGSVRDSVSSTWREFRMLIDSGGSVIIFRMDTESVSEGHGIMQLDDGGYLIVGGCYDSIAISYIMKTDNRLGVSCNSIDCPVIATNATLNGGGPGGGPSQDVINRYGLGAIAITHPPYSNSLCSDVYSTASHHHSERPDQVFIPNAFTPNNDGINDCFLPSIPSDVENYQLMIFNRWGELIFESSDPNQGWDGTYQSNKCQLGVYVWKIIYTRTSGEEQKRIGHVTLLR